MTEKLMRLLAEQDLTMVEQGLELVHGLFGSLEDLRIGLGIPQDVDNIEALFAWIGGQVRHPIYVGWWVAGRMAELGCSWLQVVDSVKIQPMGGVVEFPTIAHNISVRKLDLSGLDLEIIPTGLERWGVSELSLRDNRVDFVDLHSFRGLEQVDVSLNPIKFLVVGSLQSETLRVLKFTPSSVLQIKMIDCTLQALEVLDCRKDLSSKYIAQYKIKKIRSNVWRTHNPMFPRNWGHMPVKPRPLTPEEKRAKQQREVDHCWSWLERCPNLKELYVPDVKMVVWPTVLRERNNLEVLDISFNDCKDLSIIQASCPNLKGLYLAGTALEDWGLLAGWKHIQKLDLRLTELTEIPSSILSLAHLQRLDISFNRLKKLPLGLFHLPALKRLDVWSNHLSVEECVQIISQGLWSVVANAFQGLCSKKHKISDLVSVRVFSEEEREVEPSLSERTVRNMVNPSQLEQLLVYSQLYAQQVHQRPRNYSYYNDEEFDLVQWRDSKRYMWTKLDVQTSERLKINTNNMGFVVRAYIRFVNNAYNMGANFDATIKAIPYAQAKEWFEDGRFYRLVGGQPSQLNLADTLNRLECVVDPEDERFSISDVTSLVLWADLENDIQVTELPAEIRHFKHLTHLSLISTSITSLPEWLTELPLKEIELRGTKIRHIPVALFEFSEKLVLLKHFVKASLFCNVELEKSTLPNALQAVCNRIEAGTLTSTLQHLMLSNFQGEALPHNIGALKALRTLDVSASSLTQLPESISTLLLERLDIRGTKIVYLPTIPCHLCVGVEQWNELRNQAELRVRLQSMTFDCSGGGEILPPDNLDNLASLKRMYFKGDSIDFLPDWLTRLNLEGIYLDGARLKDVPRSLLEQSPELTLKDGKVFSSLVTGGTIESTALTNALSVICDRVEKGEHHLNVFELDLSNTSLSRLPNNIGALTKLTRLNLSNTPLTDLPDSIGALSLRSLNIRGTAIETLPSNIPAIDLSREQWDHFKTQVQDWTQLRYLTLQRCELTEIPAEIFQLSTLFLLDLRDNNIDAIPKELKNLSGLHRLLMRSNNVAEVSATSLPTTLRLLDLRRNPMLGISDDLREMQSLQIKLSKR